ncbi:MAG: septum formation protein Maf [Candidatus Omnitrophica bacterium]|nr:septum formation protein Maf [Candidatus Omnitrophota bacterium]
MKQIILASVSQRRFKILSDCGIHCQVIPSDAEEDMDPSLDISEIVQRNAVRKAEKVAQSNKGAIVIGADTLVLDGENVLGKPSSEQSAKDMLTKFSGEELFVYTGLSVIYGEKRAVGFKKSGLKVAVLTNEEIEKYFKLLAPYDKAGGFSIEGAGSIIFDNITGSYFNILGLPMRKLKDLFKEIDLDILDFIEKDSGGEQPAP